MKFKYYKTNEFAAICGVSKHTLFYYEKEDLFSPEIKDENGYRYYSAFQVGEFYLLKSLREMGMSMKECKEYMHNRSKENALNMLTDNKKSIMEQIEKLNNTLNLMNEKEELIRDYLNANKGINIIKQDKEKLYLSNSLEDEYYLAFANHLKEASKLCSILSYNIGHMSAYDNFMEKESHDYFFSKISNSNVHIKEEGMYLVYYHEHGYYSIEDAYEIIIDYINKHQLNPGKYFYENIVVDELSTDKIENYVVKVSIQIL